MFNLLKKFFKNKKVTPTLISDRLLEGAMTFVQNQKFDLNPRFSFIDSTVDEQPIYNINDYFAENIDVHNKMDLCCTILRTKHINDNLHAAFIYAHGKTEPGTRIGARFIEPDETPNCIIVDMQTRDGSAYVVIEYDVDGDTGVITNQKMFTGSDKIFFAPGHVYSRILNDCFVFFKVLKVEIDGIHILCYGNEIHDNKIKSILKPEDFHFEGNLAFEEFIASISDRINPENNSVQFDYDEFYESAFSTCHLPGSHVPVSWSTFKYWDIDRHTIIPITDSELDGYKKWEQSENQAFFL
jgi:hypothetical protein